MRMSGASGAENHLVELAAALSEHGWRSDVLIPSPRPEHLAHLVKRLVRVCELVQVMPMRHDVSPRLLARLVKLLRSGRYDIAHAHLVHADLHLALASALTRQVPLVSSKHAPDRFRCSTPFRVIERLALHRYSAVIGISSAQSQFTQDWTRTSPVTIHYGLGPLTDNPPERNSPSITRLLAVGRLEEMKGFDVALEAMRLIRRSAPHVRLAIAGEGSQRTYLTEAIWRLGLEDSVSLLGERDDVPDLMRDADVFVHPTRWEGFGLVLLEAMRAGLPVVASRVSAVPEVIEDGVTGILVPPDDPEALASALLRLVCDLPLCRKMGTAGFRRLKERFSPEAMGHRTAEVYESVVRL